MKISLQTLEETGLLQTCVDKEIKSDLFLYSSTNLFRKDISPLPSARLVNFVGVNL